MDQLFMCTKLPEDIEARENSKQIDKDLKNAKKVQLQYTQSSSFICSLMLAYLLHC